MYQADLETLEGMCPKSASEIIAMRNKVLAGIHPKSTNNHLAAVRLQYDNWQGFIDDDKLSITFHAAQEADDQEAKILNKPPTTDIPTRHGAN